MLYYKILHKIFPTTVLPTLEEEENAQYFTPESRSLAEYEPPQKDILNTNIGTDLWHDFNVIDNCNV